MLDHFEELLASFVFCCVSYFVQGWIAFSVAVRHCNRRLLAQHFSQVYSKINFKKSHWVFQLFSIEAQSN